MEKKNTLTVIILRIAQPLLLLGGLFTYTLGLGIVHYLGTPIDWTNAVLGSLLVVLLILAKNFLAAYYTYPEQIPSPGFLKEAQEGEPDFISLKELQRSILLQIALVSLSVGAGATVLLIFRKALNLAEVFTLGVALILVYFSAVPPMRLDRRGYAELIESLLLANLFPAIALLLYVEHLTK